MKVFIIAEAGVNHNGKLSMALKLCDAAKDSGVDAVKFQTFITERILTQSVAMADYQSENIGTRETQFEMVKKLELNFEDFRKIKRHCDEIGIQFLSTPDDEESLNFLVNELGLKLIKIGSSEITNIPYLRAIGQKRLPVILSTGMSTLGDIERALAELKISGCTNITLLHCTTNYPCPMKEVNLRAIISMKETFKLPVGYSDHTLGLEVPIAATALGAEILEKHFTIDRNFQGPDHKASLDPSGMTEMVRAIRNLEDALGDGIKGPNESEKKTMNYVRRSIIASCQIKSGEIFSERNLTVKRAGGLGLPADMWDFLIGRIAQRNYSEDEVVDL